MFEKLFEELAKVLMVLLAFAGGIILQYYVPNTATLFPTAWAYIKNVQSLHTDQNYILRHEPTPTP